MEADLAGRVEAVRRYNRFYTRRIGVLEEGLLRSPFSLTEARILYELAHRDEPTATELGESLDLNAGYLSRVLKGLQEKKLVRKTSSPRDGRETLLSLSEKGKSAFDELNAASRREIGAMLLTLTSEEQAKLIGAMATIEGLLGAVPEEKVPYILRPPEPGDLGWVVERHGALYAREWRWDETFEGLVAEIVGRFVRDFEPKRERCWIAEREGENVGSVFLVRDPDAEGACKLRLLLVEPKARGLGIGRRLVEECLRFGRLAGYRRIKLWTQDCLVSARKIYEATGFTVAERERHHSFGQDLVAEVWERDL